MPAQRPRAAFEPIAPTFDVNQLVEQTPNFQYVDRISCDQIAEHGIEQFEALVLQVVIKNGKPLVIDGFDSALDPWTFTPKWLRDNVGSKGDSYFPRLISLSHKLTTLPLPSRTVAQS